MNNLKPTIKRLVQLIRITFQTLYTLLQVIRHKAFPYNIARIIPNEASDIFILATGPSLGTILDQYSEELSNKDVFAVNEFCLNNSFEQIKPKYYLLADPAYLQTTNLSQTFLTIQKKIFSAFVQKVTWHMTIFIPKNIENNFKWDQLAHQNRNINILYINTNTIEGFIPVKYYLFRHNIGMPRLQNVLIGAIFICLNMGFKNIYLLGADHSLHEGLTVNAESKLCIQTKHFDNIGERRLYYKDYSETEVFKIHEFFLVWSKTFEGYHELKGYASSLKANITNLTNGSYIDAFPKIAVEEVIRR